ncbi:ArsR/SmtB family transcription factor [Deinococcus roseus]|uniref:Transcriptional regulator n=1 Tax=Deinococcus roseus TaxID=392414 RepID=A0ABQ2D9G9_9DEIO|nr:DUF5937 family protein [Deinococcus roseus]GGJ49921.1 transcriptional regulator [Deinococcus roseus]
MIRIKVSPLDLSRVRFAFSPLWECVASFMVYQSPGFHALHLPWIKEARKLLGDFDTTLLEALIPRQLGNPPYYIPDFLTPPPLTPFPVFEEEVKQILQTSTAQVVYELNKLCSLRETRPEVIDAFLLEPELHLQKLVDTLRAYWDRVMAPYWVKVQVFLENDVLVRSRTLALEGPEQLFSGIDPTIRYEDGHVLIDRGRHEDSDARGRGIVLVPSAFVYPKSMSICEEPWQPTLFYPARGVGLLWGSAPAENHDQLEILLGNSCAKVMLNLPATTLELTERLHLAPGAISHHLGRLKNLGLAEPQRMGRFVYYRLTPRGNGLLTLFKDDSKFFESIVASPSAD